MKHWMGLHMAKGHCIVCPCPVAGCNTIAVTPELISKHCTRRHASEYPRGRKGQTHSKSVVEKYLSKWHKIHNEKVPESGKWRPLTMASSYMFNAVDSDYYWHGEAGEEPSARKLAEMAIQVGHPSHKCKMHAITSKVTAKSIEAQRKLGYPSTVISKDMGKAKSAASVTSAGGKKAAGTQPGTSYSEKVKSSAAAASSGVYNGTRAKTGTYIGPGGKPLRLKDLTVKMPQIPSHMEKLQGKAGRRRSAEPVLDISQLSDVSLSVVKETAEQFARDQATRLAQSQGITERSREPPSATITSEQYAKAHKQ